MLVVLGLVVVSIASFAGGRASVPQVESKSISGVSQQVKSAEIPVVVENSMPELPITEEGVGTFVASKTGKKYFPVNCAGAKRIKDQNKVTFGSSLEAEKAGYTPAKNCK